MQAGDSLTDGLHLMQAGDSFTDGLHLMQTGDSLTDGLRERQWLMCIMNWAAASWIALCN